jgi:outer membrane lipoprotein-sorting protein
MKKILNVVLFLLFLVLIVCPVSIQEVLSKYYENMKKLQSVQGKLFIMVKTGETYNYMKMDYVSKQKKVYIKSKPPFSFILVSNGEKAHFYSSRDKTVWRYYPGQYKQVVEDPLQKKTDFLQDVLELEKIGEEYVGWKSISVYEGRPSSSNKFISKFKVWVDTENGFLHRIESYDLHDDLVSRLDFKKYRNINGVWMNLVTHSWNKTERDVIDSTSEFKDIVINGSVDESIFEFKYPEGVKIKDLTEMIMKGGKKK